MDIKYTDTKEIAVLLFLDDLITAWYNETSELYHFGKMVGFVGLL